jgi:hypothetical protein
MIRARGLLLGGACFATLVGLTIAASSTAALPRATTARTADRAGAAGSARVDAAAAAAPNSRTVVAGGETTSAFVGVPGTSESGARLSAANVPLIPTQTVSGVAPNAGASGAGGEQKVVITGSGFTGATDVFFGGTDVSSASSYPCLSSPLGCFTVVSDTEIDADTPVETAATVDVTVDTGTVNPPQDQYSYFDPPTVGNVASPQQQGATGIAVTGTNFSFPGVSPFASGVSEVELVPTGGGSTVALTAVCLTGGQANCFKATTDTGLTINLPNSMTSGQYDTQVITPGGISAISSNDVLVVLPTPTLTLLNPSSGSTLGGNDVVLTGTDLTGATAVSFGSSIPLCGAGTCFTVDSSTQITVNNVPAHAAGGITVTATTPGGTTNGKTYTYVTPPPTLTNLNLPSGSTLGGNNVILTGTNLTGATDVHVGSIDLTPCPSAPCFVVNTDLQITVTMPADTPGVANVNVTTPGGTTTSLPYTYVAPGPTVTGVSPNAGALKGGNTVALTGTGFEAAGTPITSQVIVGSASPIVTAPCGTTPTAPCFTVNSPTSITIELLPSGSGMVHITVTTPGGTSTTTSADIYTYVTTSPNVVTISPKFGAADGGAYVTVVGSNFGDPSQGFGATDVVFGTKDIPAGNTFPCPGSANGCFEQIGTTTLDVYTPAVAASTVDITVVTPGGTSNIGVPDQYTFVAKGAYTAVSPFRICDTRPAGGGITANQCDAAGKGTLVPGRETITVQITGAQIPAGAQAVVANISAINHGSGSTFVTAFPAGGSRPLASNINVAGGKVEANLAIVQLSSNGQISLFNSVGSADVIVDLEGYFSTPTGTSAGAFHSIPPLRICDSRAVPGNTTLCAKASGSTSDPLIGGTWRRLVVSGVPPGSSATGIPFDGTAAAAVFNLTGTAGSANTYLSVTAPTGSDACPTKAPAFANLNPTPGITLGNRVLSNLGPNQDICVFSAAGKINFIVDVNGWFGKGTAPAGAFFYSVPPTRICDTRPTGGTRCQGQQLTANHSQLVAVAGIVAVPAWNSHAPPPLAVVANLTGIAGSAATYLTLYPTDVTPHPTASDLNPSAGEVIGDLAITSLAQTTGSSVGNDYLYNAVGTINAVLDVAGWFQ